LNGQRKTEAAAAARIVYRRGAAGQPVQPGAHNPAAGGSSCARAARRRDLVAAGGGQPAARFFEAQEEAMNRGDFVAAVADKLGMAKTDAQRAVTAALEVLEDAVARGEEVRLAGFGVFGTRTRAAATGRNPRTGAAFEIPEARVVKFRALRELRNAVANGRRAA
jgi:DNA-binding protein HU-beta